MSINNTVSNSIVISEVKKVIEEIKRDRKVPIDGLKDVHHYALSEFYSVLEVTLNKFSNINVDEMELVNELKKLYDEVKLERVNFNGVKSVIRILVVPEMEGYVDVIIKDNSEIEIVFTFRVKNEDPHPCPW